MWLQTLVEMGYVRNSMVTSPRVCVAWGILDIYPPYLEAPIRIELFDTEVDSIRTFSADDQRSIDKLQKFVFFLLLRSSLLNQKDRH